MSTFEENLRLLRAWVGALLDPEVNEFTFIWNDPHRSGHVHWEGRNFLVPGLPVADSTRRAP